MPVIFFSQSIKTYFFPRWGRGINVKNIFPWNKADEEEEEEEEEDHEDPDFDPNKTKRR